MLLEPHPGMACQWFHSPGGDPFAAVVTAVSAAGCDLLVLAPGYHNGRPMEAVPHRAAPDAKRRLELAPDGGVWDYTPFHKAVADFVGPNVTVATNGTVGAAVAAVKAKGK